MARYEASPFGRIRGKIGEAVGEYWKGVKYMKGYTVPTDRRSQAQLNIRYLWFILGSLYGLYHSRLKDNPFSGMQNLPLLEEDYQTYLRACIKQAQNTINKIGSIDFGHSMTDFSKSYHDGEYFTETAGETPISKLFFNDGLSEDDYNFNENGYKASLILFDVANKKTWCFAKNDGLQWYGDIESGTYRSFYGEPYAIESNNYTFGMFLLDVTGTRKTDGKTVRRWSYSFVEYGKIYLS